MSKEDNILRTHIRSAISGATLNQVSLVTDMPTGESELEITLEVKVKIPTSRIDRVKRVWDAVRNYTGEVEHKLKDIVDPSPPDDYELTEKGLANAE